jgi:hypothetical protein
MTGSVLPLGWSPRCGGEGQKRTFVITDHLALIVIGHLRCSHACVSDVSRHICAPGSLVRNSFEEDRAAWAGTTEDETHFAEFEDAGGSGCSVG